MVIRDLIENIYLKKKCKSLDKKFFRIGSSILKPKKIERSQQLPMHRLEIIDIKEYLSRN